MHIQHNQKHWRFLLVALVLGMFEFGPLKEDFDSLTVCLQFERSQAPLLTAIQNQRHRPAHHTSTTCLGNTYEIINVPTYDILRGLMCECRSWRLNPATFHDRSLMISELGPQGYPQGFGCGNKGGTVHVWLKHDDSWRLGASGRSWPSSLQHLLTTVKSEMFGCLEQFRNRQHRQVSFIT